MKAILSILLICMTALAGHGQTEKVYFSYSENSFDGNLPLPSEEKFMIKGRVSADVLMVTVDVYRNVESERSLTSSSKWQRGQDKSAEEFSAMIRHKLRQDTEYDIVIRYFRGTTPEEKKYASDQLREQIVLYLDNQPVKSGRKWSWSKNLNTIVGEVEQIIQDGLADFSDMQGLPFEGLSDQVKMVLENLEAHTLRLEKQDTAVALLSNTGVYFDRLVGQIMNEVDQYTQAGLLYAFDKRTVLKYSTEKQKNILSISAGYGGVIFNNKKNNGLYDHAPYVGLSVPFGNRALRKPFWSNVSLSAGVFLLNFEDDDGNKVSGPVIQRPIYLGMGYKFLRFVKIQGGVAILETKVDDGNFVNFDQVYFRPYVGIGLEFNFWMDFAK